MSSVRRHAALLLAVAVFISPRPVRGQDVSGAWSIEVPVRVSNDGAGEVVEETATVTLTLDQDGEVIHATWQIEALPDGRTPPARAMHGTMRDGLLTLIDTTQATIQTNNGPPTTMDMVSTMELRLDGDRLTGTQHARSVDGTVASDYRPVTAVRSRGTR